ncbi:class II fructose-bisphosphatase [Candidatus Woesebacteria bacterium]|nr:MAG: class II fructose-bisphosphatase [Candidatus Woesebacteria bacterium]
MENTLGLQFTHVTEMGAIAAARASGLGDKKFADKKAVEAMRKHFNEIEFRGQVVIGEGEKDEAPMLYIGEKLGTGKGTKIDIAVDPLENTTASAKLGSRAISVLAAAEKGGLFHAPDMYMDKIVVGPESVGKIHLDAPAKDNLKAVAKSLNRAIKDLIVVILDRERHEDKIAEIRKTGARVKIVQDGDLLPGVAAAMRGTGVHIVMGIGAAPEGVITAAAIRCIGGEMQARFWPRNEEEVKRLRKMGGSEKKLYKQNDLAGGKDILFSATGVTSGDILKGVRFFGGGARTHSMVMGTKSRKVRFVDTTHSLDKIKIKYML